MEAQETKPAAMMEAARARAANFIGSVFVVFVYDVISPSPHRNREIC